MDLIAYALAKKYTEDTAIGLGAVKGAPCVIQSIEDTGTENVVTFKWTGTDGTEQTRTMTAKHGVSVTNINIDSNNNLTCTLSDGNIVDCGSVNVITDVDKIKYSNSEDASVTNVKTALDKLFEEGGGILEEPITPNVSMGSVKSNYPTGTSLEEIIRDMLTEKIAPTISMSINPATTLYDEVTASIDQLTINAIVTKKTNDIKKIEYYINNSIVKTNETGVATGGTFPYIYNETIDDDITIKVVVTDTEGMTATATKTITFIGNSYYGLIDSETGEPNEALIKTLNKNLKNTKKLVYSGITTDWAKICYAYPSELGKLTSIMDKVNNFNYTTSFQLTTKQVDGISYNVYTLIDPTGADNVELTFE